MDLRSQDIICRRVPEDVLQELVKKLRSRVKYKIPLRFHELDDDNEVMNVVGVYSGRI